MGKFKVTLQDGSKHIITTEEPVQSGVFGDIPQNEFDQGRRNFIGNLEKPGAFVRGGIRGLAPGGQPPLQQALRGFKNPALEPRFLQEQQQKPIDAPFPLTGNKAIDLPNIVAGGAGAFATDAAAFGADVVTDPVAMGLMALGKIPGVGQAGKALAGTRIGSTASVRLLRRDDSACPAARLSKPSSSNLPNVL